MKRVAAAWLLMAMIGLVAACGPVRKSVFPPLVSVQQLHVDASGQWHMQLRIQNNSYTGVKFSSVKLAMKLDGAPVGHIDAPVDLDIPALSVDVADVRLTPAPNATRTLERGGQSMPYRLTGTISGQAEQDSKSRTFKVDSGSQHTLSPTPGLTNTWR